MKEKELFEAVKVKEKWFNKNYEDLKKRYTDQFVAVVNPDDIRTDPEIDRLIEKLNQEGIDPSQVFISPIHRKRLLPSYKVFNRSIIKLSQSFF